MAENVCFSGIQGISTALRYLDTGRLEQIVMQINRANSIRLFGAGSSGLTACDLCYKLLRTGYHAIYSGDPHVAAGYAAACSRQDIGIFVSESGETAWILSACDALRQNGAAAVAITGCNSNSLFRKADYVLYTNIPEANQRVYNSGVGSRIAQLCMAEILFAAIDGCGTLGFESSGGAPDQG